MKVNVQARPSRLNFRFPFRIAHGERTGTDVVYVMVECDGFVAFGEATLPPYLPEKVEDVMAFMQSEFVQSISYPFDPPTVFSESERIFPAMMPGKAALDMALWNLKALMENKTISQVLGITEHRVIPHTYTIGIGSADMMKRKLEHGLENGFCFFKLKLNGEEDVQIIKSYLSMSEFPYAIDANQGWTDIEKAIEICELLKSSGCVLLEQPFHRNDLERTAMLRLHCGLPVIADEACQRITDLEAVSSAFSGVNIKLQKCGGLSEALQMVNKSGSLGLKVLIGCMSESSIGCNSAEALASLCDWADLDGPWLIDNDRLLLENLKQWAYSEYGKFIQL